MRKELYNKIRERLISLCVNAAGEYYTAPDDAVLAGTSLEIGRAHV